MTQGWGQPPGQGFGPPPQQQHFGPPPQPQQQGFGHPVPQQGPSTMAILALVLGAGSWVFGSIFTAIPGVILGRMELTKIDNGESSEQGRVLAQIGLWAGVANIAFTLLIFGGMCIFYVVVFGAIAASGASSSY